MLTLSETWTNEGITDDEPKIFGYRLFRKDRDGKNGGVAAYVQEKLMVTRRDDLEIDTVEALWLEVSLPKSRGYFSRGYFL